MFFYNNSGILIFFDEKKYNNMENFYNDFFNIKYGIRLKTEDTLNDIINFLND
tara:strand:+ start:488 stop:646 length:159 start_codon:yes stop_codon:yes gene_type:complete